MLVSWKWLQEYVEIDMPLAEVEDRLAMSGLNHEGTTPFGDDFCIDLEVTSNRPDCLGHIGVAREIAVLWEKDLKIPDPQPAETQGAGAAGSASVAIETPLCTRYTGRVIKGVKVGPSPDWLVERLTTLHVNPKTGESTFKSVNNIVDITNYVLMECGQPLHAFDLDKISGGKVIVREAAKGEKLEAIDHNTYDLEPGMCVIADEKTPIALGGVMGGAATEVNDDTVNLLIEAADFMPLPIRRTARRLKLFSDSSYRFERTVDPAGIEWASRRCCELILQIAGGELAPGMLDEGTRDLSRDPIVLRLPQISRILGIEVPADAVQRILTDLGCTPTEDQPDDALRVTPPTWRRDLTREIDLIEEVARVYGYDKIPEDTAVPMAPSQRTRLDRVLEKTRNVLTAAGFDEAMTVSVVSQASTQVFAPWSEAAPIVASTPMLEGANRLRKSIVPSLLNARRENQARGNSEAELFETSKVYLPQGEGLPTEPWMVAGVSGRSFFELKGVIAALVHRLNPALRLEVTETSQPLLDPAKGCELLIDGKRIGILGETGVEGMKATGLRATATLFELDLTALAAHAVLVPQHAEISEYPAITQDLNFIVDEPLRWDHLEATVRTAGGELLQQVEYRETYRNEKADGAGRKRVLLSFTLRSNEGTLTSGDAEAVREKIVEACKSNHQAVLVG